VEAVSDNGSCLIGVEVTNHRVLEVLLKALVHAPVVKPTDVMYKTLSGTKST
jgi:hypothetical protein